MEIFLRFLQVTIGIVYWVIYPFLGLFFKRSQKAQIPPIRNGILLLSLTEIIMQLRSRKLKSVQLVEAYIDRAKEVNPYVNAIVLDRFAQATAEAKRADEMVARTSDEQLPLLYAKFPLLGVPFTVKESCGLQGMPQIVGSLQRLTEKSTENGETVDLLRAAGGIPLLVSANPEYCFSIETNTYTHGRCNNPYDAHRTPGGSSGGEGALNGTGASLFGVGSDIAGSIRIPSLFNGVFGHKPTGGVTSVKGNFPNSNDPDYDKYLQVGPITRFGRDLSLILQIMAGRNAEKLDLFSPINTKDIKIFYSLGFTGLNGFLHQSVALSIQIAIMQAAKYFKQMGLPTEVAHIRNFHNSTEIALSAIARIKDFPFLINNSNEHKVVETLKEYVKSIVGYSAYTRDGLLFELMRRTNAFMPRKSLKKYERETELLKQEVIELLGPNGVLFFPTFHVLAIHHYTSHLPLWGIDYSLVFNVLGFPATHVPMGLDEQTGLPVGFQVIAAPFKDKLCLHIAGELEQAFGGWKPPTKHDIRK